MRSHDPLLFRRAPRPSGDYRVARQEREAWLYLGLILLVVSALLLLGCARQRPADMRVYRPRNYRSHAQYLRSSAIRQREVDAELHSAREAQRRAKALHPSDY